MATVSEQRIHLNSSFSLQSDLWHSYTLICVYGEQLSNLGWQSKPITCHQLETVESPIGAPVVEALASFFVSVSPQAWYHFTVTIQSEKNVIFCQSETHIVGGATSCFTGIANKNVVTDGANMLSEHVRMTARPILLLWQSASYVILRSFTHALL